MYFTHLVGEYDNGMVILYVRGVNRCLALKIDC
jgi:hypothetical protein